jgi:rod shape-determining protein MreC
LAVRPPPARQRFVLAVVTLLSVTVVTLDLRGQGGGVVDGVRSGARDALAPVEAAVGRVAEPVGDMVGGMLHYGELEAENARLHRRLEEESGYRLRAEDAERERRRLLEQERLSFAGHIPALSARVVSTAPSNFDLAVEIDKGSSAGVTMGMPVITGAGLVGTVAEASTRRAVVRLVVDPAFDVGVRLSRSGDEGVARGRGRSEDLPVDLVDPATVVEPGEVAVTSGLEGSTFPAGIPVGVARPGSARPGALQKDLALDPVVDLGRLEVVKVLQWIPG